MGKEQDLLDAARTGNLAVIEKVLNIRTKKSVSLGLKQLQGAFDRFVLQYKHVIRNFICLRSV